MNIEDSVDNLSNRGQYMIADFNWAWWGFPDVRVIDDTKIEVDDCEQWTENYYRRDSGALVSSEPTYILPQTITIERLNGDWVATNVVFYDPPHFCPG